MSLLILPAGQTLRQVAERLGVSITELQRHAGVQDTEAPMDVERRVQVPDGFLKSRTSRRHFQDAVPGDSGCSAGMNMWLALDIEQKRTRAAGGMRAHAAVASEEEALAEARRAYLRFEADSNQLAAELYDQITATHSIGVRARAFAGQGLALAQGGILFGVARERSRPQALSAAKAALLADPKLADAHLAMALALEIDAGQAALEEALAQLERAVEVDREAAWCWSEIAALLERRGDLDGAEAVIEIAMQLAPDWVFTLQSAASLALRRGEAERGLELLRRAAEAVPTFANPHAHLALALAQHASAEEAAAARQLALSLTGGDSHREAVMALLEHGSFPARL